MKKHPNGTKYLGLRLSLRSLRAEAPPRSRIPTALQNSKNGSAMARSRRWAMVASAASLAVVLPSFLGTATALAATTYPITSTLQTSILPLKAAVNATTNTVYVTSNFSADLEVINGATNTVTSTIALPGVPTSVAVDTGTNTVYVTDYSGLVAINGATNSPVQTIPMAGVSHVTVDQATNTVFASNTYSNTISAVKAANNQVESTIHVIEPGPMAVDPATNTLYAASSLTGTIYAIDAITFQVRASINLPGARNLAVDPVTNTVYATDSVGLVAINGATNQVTSTLQLYGPGRVAVDPTIDTVYVASEFARPLYVINGATNTLVASDFTVYSDPDGLAVNTTTHAVYITNEALRSISVLTPVIDSDLSMTSPANLTVNATSSSGAAVNYSLPVVSDPGDATLPVATCSQPSGSVFPVGTTTVTCSVTDSEDTPSTVTTSFTVTVKDTDLAIASPSNLTVNATSPSGAAVNYSQPVVSDPDDATLPVATCSQPSGSVFPVGTTTVTCSVTDSEDTPSTVTTSFTIDVLGAKSQLQNLESSVIGVGPGKSLSSKIQVALSDLNSGNPSGAKSVLRGFVNEVRALSGKKISKAVANALIAAALRITNVIG